MANTKKKAVASRSKKHSSFHSTTDKDSAERRTEIAIFTLVGYSMLRSDDPKKKGAKHSRLHTVWTGFNTVFREFFPDEDPIQCQKQMVDDGLIVTTPFRGGALLQPTIDLLREPTEEERAIAKRVRAFIPEALARYQAAQAAYKAGKNGAEAKDKPKGSRKELKAATLMKDGDVEKALEVLGYK